MASGKNCLGLDIGSSTVKLCELRSRNEELHLETFDYTSLPHEAIVDGELMNVTAVADAISTLLDRNDVRRTETALSISGNTVIIKKITLPLMTQEELEESIQWEAEQFIPFDIEDVFIGFEVLAPRTEQGQMDVVLVAAKKEMINDYVGVCHRSGLDPLVVDGDSVLEPIGERFVRRPEHVRIELRVPRERDGHAARPGELGHLGQHRPGRHHVVHP
ncbi:MAG: type IV pilus biogenesis protein PilM [Bradymonadaceae bacterium]